MPVLSSPWAASPSASHARRFRTVPAEINKPGDCAQIIHSGAVHRPAVAQTARRPAPGARVMCGMACAVFQEGMRRPWPLAECQTSQGSRTGKLGCLDTLGAACEKRRRLAEPRRRLLLLTLRAIPWGG
jgi:hypothetical protein